MAKSGEPLVDINQNYAKNLEFTINYFAKEFLYLNFSVNLVISGLIGESIPRCKSKTLF